MEKFSNCVFGLASANIFSASLYLYLPSIDCLFKKPRFLSSFRGINNEAHPNDLSYFAKYFVHHQEHLLASTSGLVLSRYQRRGCKAAASKMLMIEIVLL
jgi:hypothetical protein